MKLLTAIFGAVLVTGCVQAQPVESPEQHVPIVGLPCDGCDAVFVGMPETIGSHANLAPESEPGERLKIEGRVLDGLGRPVEGIVVYAYQTDARGIYPRVEALRGGPAFRHGRLRAWVVSDEQGRYSFDTIRPASYPDTTVPQHIHMHVLEPDCCTYYIEDIFFEDDPMLTPAQRRRMTSGRGGPGIVNPVKSVDGVWFVTRDIVLGENIPGYAEARTGD